MATVRLNKDNNFRQKVTATVRDIKFLVQGGSADCLVYMPPGQHLVGEVKGVSAGNVATVSGVTVDQLIEVSINTRNPTLVNATVTY
jgi:hypothetical protein